MGRVDGGVCVCVGGEGGACFFFVLVEAEVKAEKMILVMLWVHTGDGILSILSYLMVEEK